MKMHFRTFNGFVEEGLPDDPGLSIVYSLSEHYNLFCLHGGDGYREYCLRDYTGWMKYFSFALSYMATYDEMGCFTFRKRSDSKRFHILTEYVDYEPYRDVAGVDSFYVIYNARPIKPVGPKPIRIGHKFYSLKMDKKSIIVWNLPKYMNQEHLRGYTLWGVMDGEFVGVKNGKRVKLQ